MTFCFESCDISPDTIESIDSQTLVITSAELTERLAFTEQSSACIWKVLPKVIMSSDWKNRLLAFITTS